MAAVMVIVMLAALTGCVGKEDTQTRKKNKVVEIPMILAMAATSIADTTLRIFIIHFPRLSFF